MKRKVTISLEENLVKRIDGERGRVPRSAAIEEMILKHYMMDEGWK